MTMSISSAPASIAWRVSASLRSRNVWPLGKPVATLATWTPGRPERLARLGHERRVDADRRDVRDRRIARLRVDRLGAQRPDLARGVLPLERGQVDHPDRQVERPQLRGLLDRALLERLDPLVDPDLVDRADPSEQPAERARPPVEGPDELVGALPGEPVRSLDRRHRAVRIHRVAVDRVVSW